MLLVSSFIGRCMSTRMGSLPMTDKRAEESRVKAESGRVIAEKERVVNEKDEEHGRVVAEEGRVSAEKGRITAHAVFEHELDALRNDPSHYMTPGARRYFRRVALGYIILAIGMSFGIKALSDNVDNNIRRDINKVAEAQCLGSIPTLNKFNAFVDLVIEANRDAREIALREGDTARVRLNTNNIIKLQESKLRVPSVRECEAPILK